MNTQIETYGDNVLKCMGNHSRLQVLFALRKQEMSVGQIEKIVGLSQSALSQHLAVLRKEGIVKTRRSAQTIYYSIKSELALNILEVLDKFYYNRY